MFQTYCQCNIPTEKTLTGLEGKVTIFWNQQVQVNRAISNNKLDTINCDNEKGTCMLTDITISGRRNNIEKEAKKILKYEAPYNRNRTHVECKK